MYEMKRGDLRLEVEAAVHKALAQYRVSADCEFFRLDGVDYPSVIQDTIREYDSQPYSTSKCGRIVSILENLSGS
ncbi:hypothetical protein F8203_gp156 [Heliothis virescens ascovirus 3f]|uniref:Uncharacterized protein n=1 Tax=Heliothis virescens ascovirus 3f TaxID=328614 RepID=A0A171PVP7_9VIRU|nr:hypothetical protein F8203_gp156 [Heliothis virescens ascovirus 3f]AJP09122.1 hypothetical protein [Heliothis virescens ascovirus 3f]